MTYIKAIAVGLAIGLILALSIPPVDANESRRQQHRDAYIIAKVTYKTVPNDEYLEIFQKSHVRMNGLTGDILARAAIDVCAAQGGVVEEDFSCSTPEDKGFE